MNKPKTDVTRAVALAALLGGAGACAESEGGGSPVATGDDPVESAIANLGVPINGCDGASTSGGAGFASGTLTFNLATDAMVLSAPAGIFAANGAKCTQTVMGKQVALKTSDVTKIVINGTMNDDKIILDLLPGTFGTKVFAANGGVTIDLNTASGGDDSVMLRAGTTSETFRFAFAASGANMSTTDNVYIEVTNDKTADIDIKPSTTMSGGTLSLTASMGGGNDTVIANTPAADIDKYSAQTGLMVGPLPASLGVTAYGGPGDDKFTGSLGNDAFYGGEGADLFKMLGTADGSDIYQGDSGNDTVEYLRNSGDQQVDLGPATPAIEGGADLRAPSLYGASGLLSGKTLGMIIDGVRVETTFTPAPSNPKAVVDAINTAANTALNTMNKVYATLHAKNHLVISSLTNVAGKSMVKIEENPAITGAATSADGELGYTSIVGMAQTTFPVVGDDVSPTTLYGNTPGAGVLINRRFLALFDGVYISIDFTAPPADENGLVTLLNSTIRTALNNPTFTYAELDPSTNELWLRAQNSLTILDGTTNHAFTGASAAGLLGLRSSVEGTVDMTTASLYGAGMTLDTKTISLVIDGVRVQAALSAPANSGDVTTAINSAMNTALGTSGVVYASINRDNHLLIKSRNDAGGVSEVRLVDDPNITGAAMAAEGALMLSGAGKKLVGVDLNTLTYGAMGTLDGMGLTLIVNGYYVQPAWVNTSANKAALLTYLNTTINTAVGTSGVVYAAENAKDHKLELSANWITVVSGTANVTYVSANTALGLTSSAGIKRDVYDFDDGLAGEYDDVRATIENITAGGGNDVLVGNNLKNTIKGGAGNDLISGGANSSCTTADADSLQGEGDNDTFVAAAKNCKASISGGDGDNVADFSGRTTDLILRNNGTADDGEGDEAANVAADIRKLIGGFGADELTAGAGDDILIGGPGADKLVGGAGVDTVDYSGATAAVDVSLCFTTTLALCGMTGNDGVMNENDQTYQVEHVVGSGFNDVLSGSTAGATIDLIIEGGAGNDTITGGAGIDELYGDAGDDTLNGGAGDDRLQGDAGDDTLNGGDGDGDICLGDSSDITTPATACEP